MRLPRDADEFTTRILDEDCAGKPEKAVALCRALLASDRLPEGISRAEVLCELGEHLDRAGSHVQAGEAFLGAIIDGGPTSLDPRCLHARWCYEHGDPDQAAQVLRELWSERRRDLRVCTFIGELHEQRGELAEATRWLAAGAVWAERHFEDDPSLDIVPLLAVRRRVRQAQGLLDDDLDELATRLQLRLLETLIGAGSAA